VIAVDSTFFAWFGHDADVVSGVTTFVLPVEEVVFVGVVDQVDGVKA